VAKVSVRSLETVVEMGKLVRRACQCEEERDHITVSRFLPVPVAKGL